MRELELPCSISKLVDNLQILQFVWQGIPIQLPKFAVYAVLDNPVLDRHFYRSGRKMGLVKMGRYQIPIIDPFKGNIDSAPDHLVVISHSRANRFGLYAYPADHIDETIELSVNHRSVRRIVKDFI